AEDGIRDFHVTGVQTCALPIFGYRCCPVATVGDVELPDVVRAKAEQAGAGAWVAGLPELVAGLERDWGITVGRAYPDPTEAFVEIGRASCRERAEHGGVPRTYG